MKGFTWRALCAAVVGSGLSVALLLSASQASAQALKEQLVGSWKLVSIYNEKDGVRKDTFGPSPLGLYTFDKNGNFSQIILRSGLPKFTSGTREKGTPEENQAVVQGSNAYFGTYTVGEGGKVTLNIVASTYPNWTQTTATRTVTVSGDELKSVNPTPSAGGGTAYTVWTRAK
jgi:hypothetical protein